MHKKTSYPIASVGGKKRGHERIRTAVDGFADHCLATRPRDLIRFCDCKNRHIIVLVKYRTVIIIK